MSLPVKLGGIGITNITSISDTECQTSKIITKNFMNEIKNKKCESNANLEKSSNQQDTKSSNEFFGYLFKNLR